GRGQRQSVWTAKHWAAVERAGRSSLASGRAMSRVFGTGPLRGAAGAMRWALDEELVPTWPQNMPPPARPRLPDTKREGAAAVYSPACINRIFGRARGANGKLSLAEA